MPSSRTYPIPARLAEARKRAGLTQEKAAEQAGPSTTSITRYERALGYPSQAALKLLDVLYGTSTEWLLGGPAEPDPEQSDIEADWELIENEASLALRQVTRELSPEAIKAIADFVRFTYEREERARRERDGE